jgi:hypothetical protein
MWVGPPSPAQPDSLGFGIDELEEEALMTGYVGMDVHRKRSQVAIVDAAPDPQVQALMVLPGVGKLTAMTLVAEIGEGACFPTARKLCAWAGLTPQVRNSDRKVRHGHITKQGSPWVRGIPQEAARGPNGCMRANSEPVRAFSLLRSRHHHNPARPRADPARPDNARPHGCGNAGPHSGDSKIHGKDGATRL